MVYGVLGAYIFYKWYAINLKHGFFAFCPQFLQNIKWQLTTMTLLAVLLFTMVLRGGSYLWQQLRNNQKLLGRLQELKISLPAELENLTRKYGLQGKIFYTVDTEPYAFVCGLLKPRIVLSRGLFNTLTTEELEAVLLHENYHLIEYDPLKITLGGAIARSLFFIPLAGQLYGAFKCNRELAADASAVRVQGDNLGLALALQKLLQAQTASRSDLAARVGIIGTAELRITQLIEGEKSAKITIVRKGQVLLTAAIILVTIMLLLTRCV
ncbi:peptidase M56 [Calderihabitans maritimus]|uniref:Peptidase M56 n=1 Tax=Calderihabitans maritimus TaxID=1246530 RepID=A0A1Z5HTD2_9FIRM|nr:peptidase M56 [Calderihabitans maritimus]